MRKGRGTQKFQLTSKEGKGWRLSSIKLQNKEILSFWVGEHSAVLECGSPGKGVNPFYLGIPEYHLYNKPEELSKMPS